MELLYIFIPMILMFLSQSYINSTYSKYKTVKSRRKMNGYNTARKMIEMYDLKINIEKVSGTLSDHFDPKMKVIRLSEDVYDNESIASIAIAAHECAHVMQHKEGYLLIKLRSLLVPVVSLTSKLGYVVLALGILSSVTNQIIIGLIIMGSALLFQLVTLPVEFDASRRAKKILIKENIITTEEQVGVNKMLKSAAFTYVASFLVSMMQIFRLLSILRKK